MIAIIPALDFMHGLRGNYSSNNSEATLRVRNCGYGLALEVGDGKKTQFVGVIGVHGTGIECFAQMGLPNVLRLTGDLVSKHEIRLACDDLPFAMSIVGGRDEFRLAITLSDVEKVAHVFRPNADADDAKA
jgi:hypothetical protein